MPYQRALAHRLGVEPRTPVSRPPLFHRAISTPSTMCNLGTGTHSTKPFFNDKISDKSADNQSEARISLAYNKKCHLLLMTSFVNWGPGEGGGGGMFHKDPKPNLTLVGLKNIEETICSLKIKCIQSKNSSILDFL